MRIRRTGLLLFCGAAILTLAVWSAPEWNATFGTGVTVDRTPYGPVRVAVRGQIGDRAADAQNGPSKTIIPASGFVGHTPEELQLNQQLNEAMKRVYERVDEIRGGVGPAMAAAGISNVSSPAVDRRYVELPNRNLTREELTQMRRDIAEMAVDPTPPASKPAGWLQWLRGWL